jgi:hypothetical protein
MRRPPLPDGWLADLAPARAIAAREAGQDAHAGWARERVP